MAPRSDWSLRPLEDELGEVLRAELLSWPGMRARPVMGSLGFFRGRRMLGCYVNRALPRLSLGTVTRSTQLRVTPSGVEE